MVLRPSTATPLPPSSAATPLPPSSAATTERILVNLPLDLWAEVARFLPSRDRERAFWSLRRALVIATHGTLHETHMRFLELAAREEEEAHARYHPGVDPLWPTWSPDVEQMLVDDMGFARDAAVRALILTGGDRYHAIMMLLSEVDWYIA